MITFIDKDGTEKTNIDLGFKVKTDSEGMLLPATKDRIEDIPFLAGEVDMGSEPSSITHNLQCRVLGKSNANLVETRNKIASFFTDEKGRAKTVKVIFDYEPDKYYKARYNSSIPIQKQVTHFDFTLPLISFDPFKRASANEYDEVLLYDDGNEYDQGDIYPNEETIQLQSGLNMMSFYNYSDKETAFKVIIDGQFDNLIIKDELTGEEFTLNDSGNSAVVDMERKQVAVNGENALKNYGGDFLTLQPGENEFKIYTDTADGQITFEWEHRFI